MFNLPSPLQFVPSSLFSEKKLSVWVKRDDLIHPIVSGNKLRKLKGWLEIAAEKQVNTLVSFGGAYSNHLIAMACAGRLTGYKTIGFVRGDEAADNLVLQHCKLMGMKLIYVDREFYRNKEDLYLKHFKDRADCLYIPEGGGGETGMIGFKDFVQEPDMQADYMIVSAGTGTSARGIRKALENSACEVLAMACVKDASLLEFEQEKLRFNFDFVGKGFGKYDEEIVKLCQEIYSETGILFDPIYTAKAWKGFISLAKQNYFKPNSRIIFVHTGGLTGWWGMKSKL